MLKKLIGIFLAFILCFGVFGFAGCSGGYTPPIDDGGGVVTPDPGPKPDPDNKVIYSSDYVPTTFSVDTLKYTVAKLGDGVRMVKNSYKLANGHDIIVYATEIDLKKADIKAGCNLNDTSLAFAAKQVPYSQMAAWEEDNLAQKVLFATNADFFGGNTSVNAFVKDGKIIKSGHNDDGKYDYRTATSTDDALRSDVPASAPMLFGVKGTTAQIAPIKSYMGDITAAAVKETVIKSKLFYKGVFEGDDSRHIMSTNVAPYNDKSGIIYLDDTNAQFKCRKGSAVIKVKLTGDKTVVTENRVLADVETLTPESGFALIVAHPEYKELYSVKKVSADSVFSMEVSSEDGTWDGYTTILGCRQALIIDGKIPPTVKLENTNGAQNTNVPRTSVGIKKDGTVVLFSAEGLTYGKFGDENSTFGLNLPEIADFIRYYDCLQSANFDGGGSTQVIMRGGLNGSGDPKVLVRSSDTGSTELINSRPVINTFLVTTKKA